MKTSQLFTKTSKTAPADETSRSAELLLRAGYIYKEMAGVYDFLPLGMRTLQNIIQIIVELSQHSLFGFLAYFIRKSNPVYLCYLCCDPCLYSSTYI